MENPAVAMQRATANWKAVTDASKAESERIRKEREGETTGEAANQADTINRTGA